MFRTESVIDELISFPTSMSSTPPFLGTRRGFSILTYIFSSKLIRVLADADEGEKYSQVRGWAVFSGYLRVGSSTA